MEDSLPSGWEWTQLQEIAEINPRHSLKLSDSQQVTFVPMPALSESTWNFDFTEERPLGKVRKGYTHFAEGDVLVAKITPCMENGKGAVATNLKNGLGCGTTELHVIRPLGKIDPKYIYYCTHQDSFRQEAAQNFTGTAGQLRVPVSFIRETIIPLAPLPEQRRIVAKLEKLLSKVKASQKRLDRIPTILKRFRQSVLAAASSGRLTEDWRKENKVQHSYHGTASQEIPHGIPDNWIWVELKELSDAFQYGTSAKSNGEGKVAVLRMGNLQNGKIDWSDLKYTSDDQEIRKYSLEVGDVLFNRTNSPELVGKTSIYEGGRRAIFAGYLIRVRYKKEYLDSHYLSYCLNTTRAKEWCSQVKTDGVSQSNINAQILSTFLIPLPPLSEQQEIVRRVEAMFSLSDKIESPYKKANAQVDKLAQSILAKAFRGELIPQDPNDEPASVLLKRIGKEKIPDHGTKGKVSTSRQKEA